MINMARNIKTISIIKDLSIITLQMNFLVEK